MGLDLITVIVIGITCAVSFKGFNDPAFKSKYLFWIGAIQRGEQYRFLTSAFLHANGTHLAFNMISLYFFASYVVNDLGDTGFLLVYVAGLLVGNLLSFYLHKNEYQYSALGASGAVMAIVYSGILLEPYLYIYGIIPGYVFAVGYLFYSIYGMKKNDDLIGHDAHFGGAVAGFTATLLFKPSIIMDQTMTVALMLLPILVFYVMKKTGKL
jgi:membrane associated rhomboid family serine protease